MKLNWGTSIAIFYTLFVIAMIFAVVKSAQNETHMVQENYYQKDLNYESFRQKRQNGLQYSSILDIKYNAGLNQLQIAFPTAMSQASGELTLFRPSNQYLDKKFTLKLDAEGKMNIPLEEAVARGKWKLLLDWNYSGTDFYNEQEIII